MKIVIDIPDDRYEELMTDDIHLDVPIFKEDIIATLPERHGDLVDKYDILHDIDCDEEMRLGKNIEWVREVIRNAPTVIEATENTNKEVTK